MSFTRHPAERWHLKVPGARWFKADLHVHTIDDRAGKRAKMPDGLSGNPEAPEVLGCYAKRFLQGAVAAGVQVLGLTPHSPRVGTAPETSAVWKIVEEWNSGNDDDGVAFRDKIYAVFPGFEPSLKDGREGLHLLFLFDPEIGRDCYLKLFELLMGGVGPWKQGQLEISTKDADKVFDELHEFRDRECPEGDDGERRWGHLVLAPHIDSPKGLLSAKRKQVLELFDHGEVAGLELSDDKLPDDALENRKWLTEGMAKHRQAFFHGSDAYSLSEIGQRHTWLKLASPRIEALRQAFIASDSRMRIGFERAKSGGLQPIANLPDVTLSQRPWLKKVSIRGEASFLGSANAEPAEFELSPDLTCLIGGSMTGKSTLLDGLRVHLDADPPKDPALSKQVEERGRGRLLAGAPKVELDCPGRDATAPLHEQWPAVFYTQNELQRLALEPAAVEETLGRLVPAELEGIERRRSHLKELDAELARGARRLAELDEQAADAEQACERARKAKKELSAFAEAGVERLHQAGRARSRWDESRQNGGELRSDLDGLLGSAGILETPEIDSDLASALADDLTTSALRARWQQVTAHLESAKRELDSWIGGVGAVADGATKRERDLQTQVEQTLAKLGFDASRLKEFQALNQQASLLASYEANRKESESKVAAAEKSQSALEKERKNVVTGQREAFDSVMNSIRAEFGERIRASRVECGDSAPLEKFLHALTQRGITRWWNEMEERKRPSPEQLIEALEQARKLAKLGMSSAVQKTFGETMTVAKRRELAAIRCPDHYRLELRMDDGSYRPLDELSGGQRVSVVLSLLLETTDERPLVIDQPEDELDNRFLFETVLPALKKLKGRRQVIVATHNANIVVNGDADMVIELEATANRGRVAASGAIEEPAVRDAIVRTVDGGAEAFRLRRLKYGF